MMKLTAQDLYTDGIVEEIIAEPLGGAQRGRQLLFSRLDTAIAAHLAALCKMSGKALARPEIQKVPPYRRNEGSMKGLQLLATGGATAPGRVVTNEDLSRQVDTSDEWITTRTGIRQRYYCTESEDAATLAIAAARQALARSGLAASEIACCVAATLSGPTATPKVLPAVCRRPWGPAGEPGPLLM